MSLLTLGIEAKQLAHTIQERKHMLNRGVVYEEAGEFSTAIRIFISDLKI
jgi:hypothetical protein